MKKSTTAIALSALGFPGAGQLYLKRYISGGLLTGVTIVALFVLSVALFEVTNSIAEKIVNGDMPVDIPMVMALVSQQITTDEIPLAHKAIKVIVVTWIASLAHVLLITFSQKR